MKCPPDANAQMEGAMGEKKGKLAEVSAALSACRPLRTIIVRLGSAALTGTLTVGSFIGGWYWKKLSAAEGLAGENAHRIDRLGDAVQTLHTQNADTKAAVERLRADINQQLTLIAGLLQKSR